MIYKESNESEPNHISYPKIKSIDALDKELEGAPENAQENTKENTQENQTILSHSGMSTMSLN